MGRGALAMASKHAYVRTDTYEAVSRALGVTTRVLTTK